MGITQRKQGSRGGGPNWRHAGLGGLGIRSGRLFPLARFTKHQLSRRRNRAATNGSRVADDGRSSLSHIDRLAMPALGLSPTRHGQREVAPRGRSPHHRFRGQLCLAGEDRRAISGRLRPPGLQYESVHVAGYDRCRACVRWHRARLCALDQCCLAPL